jgi:hypothetical protein
MISESPVTAAAIKVLWNDSGNRAALDPVLTVVLRSMSPTDRARERDTLIAQGRAMLPELSDFEAAGRLQTRMSVLANVPPQYLDTGLLDGLLALAVLINNRKAPSFSTVFRAI